MFTTGRPLDLERWRTSAPTYDEIGATRDERHVEGSHHLRRSAELGTGADVFARGADCVMSWDMHRRAGFVVYPTHAVAAPDAVVAMVLGLGGIGLVVPCRVVYVVEEPRRRGIAYGTLPGHPESGEEFFVVERGDDNVVRMTITAFSRPATLLPRLAGPVGRRAQAWMTDRYLSVVSDAAASPG